MGSSRRYPQRPMVGVGAVLLDDQKRVLFIQRGSEPGRGKWSFPGGLVKVGEPLRQAARREALEETGLEVDLQDVVQVVEKVERDDAQRVEFHYVIIDFIGTVRGGELRAADDVTDARWVDLDEPCDLPLTTGALDVAWRARDLAEGRPPRIPLYLEE